MCPGKPTPVCAPDIARQPGTQHLATALRLEIGRPRRELYVEGRRFGEPVVALVELSTGKLDETT